MAGSIALTARAALHSGAGLVTAAVPDRVLETVAGFCPAVMTTPLACDHAGCLTLTAIEELLDRVSGHDAVAIGPGLSRADQTQSLVRELLPQIESPVVLDADALHAVATDRACLTSDAPRVLTPHPGEFAALTNATVAEVQSDREAAAARLAAETGTVVVLKGSGTVVTDSRRTVVNKTGNAGMATGGAGDVLTGMTAALLAVGMDPFDAARLAVHAHGLAGDAAAERLSRTGMTATDLLDSVPRIWKAFER